MKIFKKAILCILLFFCAVFSASCTSNQKEDVSLKFESVKDLEEYKISFSLLDQSKKDIENEPISEFDFVNGIILFVQGKSDKKQVELRVDFISNIVSLQSILKIDHDKYDFLGNRYTNEQMQTQNTISTDDRIVYIHDFKYIFSEFVKKFIARITNDKLELADSTIKLLNEDAIEVQSYSYHFDEEQLKSFAVDFLKALKSEERLNTSVKNFLKSLFVAKEYEDNVDLFMSEMEKKTEEELVKSVDDFLEKYKSHYKVDKVEANLCLKVDKDEKIRQCILKIIDEEKETKSEHFLLDMIMMKP